MDLLSNLVILWVSRYVGSVAREFVSGFSPPPMMHLTPLTTKDHKRLSEKGPRESLLLLPS